MGLQAGTCPCPAGQGSLPPSAPACLHSQASSEPGEAGLRQAGCWVPGASSPLPLSRAVASAHLTTLVSTPKAPQPGE